MGPSGPQQLPSDDDPIPDDVLLHRLVPPRWWHVVAGEWRVISGGLDNSSGGGEDMSVILGDTLAAMGRTPESLVANRPDCGVVTLRAGTVRAEGQTIVRTREADEPAHGDVVGTKGPGKRKRLVRDAVHIIKPTIPPE